MRANPRPTRSTPHSTRSRALRGAVAGTAVAALALTLAPGAAPAQAADKGEVDVHLKVATQPAVAVEAVRRAWPARVLARQGITVDRNDIVEVVRDGREVKGDRKRVRQGDVVRLVVVDKKRTSKRVKIRPGVVEVPTTELAPGRRKVVRTGKPGVAKVVVKRTFHNGERVERRVLSRKTVKKATPRRVLVGRRPYSVAGADGLNWGALANCESGGNPRAVNPAGYYGLYQFDLGTWRSVGGSGMPSQASAGEQTYRAKLLYKQRGRSPWPTCGRLL